MSLLPVMALVLLLALMRSLHTIGRQRRRARSHGAKAAGYRLRLVMVRGDSSNSGPDGHLITASGSVTSSIPLPIRGLPITFGEITDGDPGPANPETDDPLEEDDYSRGYGQGYYDARADIANDRAPSPTDANPV